jgi:hypothetical protein
MKISLGVGQLKPSDTLELSVVDDQGSFSKEEMAVPSNSGSNPSTTPTTSAVHSFATFLFKPVTTINSFLPATPQPIRYLTSAIYSNLPFTGGQAQNGGIHPEEYSSNVHNPLEELPSSATPQNAEMYESRLTQFLSYAKSFPSKIAFSVTSPFGDHSKLNAKGSEQQHLPPIKYKEFQDKLNNTKEGKELLALIQG